MPGEFHGQRSLVGYSPWGHTESDKTEQLTHTHTHTHTHRVHKLTYLPKVRNDHEVRSTLASKNIDMTKLQVTDRPPPN